MSRAPVPNPTGVATRLLLRVTVPWFSAVFGVVALGYAAIAVGIVLWGNPEHSVWASVHWALQWLGFPAGVTVGAATPVLVAHGVTRHRAALATAQTVLLLAAGMAGAVLAGLVIEQVAHQIAGLPHRIDGSHLFAGVGQVQLVFAEYFLIFAGFMAAGWLVATGYLRLRPRGGTAVLPLTFLPGVCALGAISAGWRGPVDPDSPPWVGSLNPLAAVAIATTVVLAGLLAAYLTTRRMPIK